MQFYIKTDFLRLDIERAKRIWVNPRTDGGSGHLSTDGGGADNRPPEISKTKQARDKR